MILTIQGVLGGADLSPYIDRQAGVTIDASVGKRMDTIEFSLYDADGIIVIPDRAEIVVNDYDPALLPVGWVRGQAPILDPTTAEFIAAAVAARSFFNVWDGVGKYDSTTTYDMPDAAIRVTPNTWTPRLFAGYVASAQLSSDAGLSRNIHVAAQDYTVRNPATLVNRAYAPDAIHTNGWTDAQIVRDIFNLYRPDLDTSDVATLVNVMPTISFPTHSIEQFMERVLKISAGYYRVDYFKRLHYGTLGQQAGPYNITDTPHVNLLTANQASLETNSSEWSVVANATLARTIVQAFDGGASLGITATASGDAQVRTTPPVVIAQTPQTLPMALPNSLEYQ